MKKTKELTIALVSITFLINLSCSVKDSSIAEGEALARTNCAACHAFPDPKLLDQKTWVNNVLPKMAKLMFVESKPNDAAGTSGNVTTSGVNPNQFFPYKNWEKIVRYYTTVAPEQIPARTDSLPPIHIGMKKFSAHPLFGNFPNPITTLVYFDTLSQKIFFADGNLGKAFVANSSLDITEIFFTGPGATDIHLGKNISVVIIGDITPSDLPRGKLEILRKGEEPQTIIGNLRRPVHATYADLTNDGLDDIIICEFGFTQGSLSWFENKGNANYEQHMLRALPGAIRTEVYDFNKDGKLDIIAMMAQGDEGVFIYYNEGNGKFK